jgi:hypothetical protein
MKRHYHHMSEIPIESIYFGKSLYLSSLCNIHMGKKENAILTLQVIVLTQPDFKDKSKRID